MRLLIEEEGGRTFEECPCRTVVSMSSPSFLHKLLVFISVSVSEGVCGGVWMFMKACFQEDGGLSKTGASCNQNTQL